MKKLSKKPKPIKGIELATPTKKNVFSFYRVCLKYSLSIKFFVVGLGADSTAKEDDYK